MLTAMFQTGMDEEPAGPFWLTVDPLFEPNSQGAHQAFFNLLTYPLVDARIGENFANTVAAADKTEKAYSKKS